MKRLFDLSEDILQLEADHFYLDRYKVGIQMEAEVRFGERGYSIRIR